MSDHLNLQRIPSFRKVASPKLAVALQERPTITPSPRASPLGRSELRPPGVQAKGHHAHKEEVARVFKAVYEPSTLPPPSPQSGVGAMLATIVTPRGPRLTLRPASVDGQASTAEVRQGGRPTDQSHPPLPRVAMLSSTAPRPSKSLKQRRAAYRQRRLAASLQLREQGDFLRTRAHQASVTKAGPTTDNLEAVVGSNEMPAGNSPLRMSVVQDYVSRSLATPEVRRNSLWRFKIHDQALKLLIRELHSCSDILGSVRTEYLKWMRNLRRRMPRAHARRRRVWTRMARQARQRRKQRVSAAQVVNDAMQREQDTMRRPPTITAGDVNASEQAVMWRDLVDEGVVEDMGADVYRDDPPAGSYDGTDTSALADVRRLPVAGWALSELLPCLLQIASSCPVPGLDRETGFTAGPRPTPLPTHARVEHSRIPAWVDAVIDRAIDQLHGDVAASSQAAPRGSELLRASPRPVSSRSMAASRASATRASSPRHIPTLEEKLSPRPQTAASCASRVSRVSVTVERPDSALSRGGSQASNAGSLPHSLPGDVAAPARNMVSPSVQGSPPAEPRRAGMSSLASEPATTAQPGSQQPQQQPLGSQAAAALLPVLQECVEVVLAGLAQTENQQLVRVLAKVWNGTFRLRQGGRTRHACH